MFRTVNSAALCGIESRIISIEADASDGLPGFSMVGYLSSEVREAQDRVRTALKNSGFSLKPKRVTVNLAPADIRKSGTGFDLPIAVAVWAAQGYLPQTALDGVFLAGELGLDGSVRGIHGILGMVMEAKRLGLRACIIPEANVLEGAVIDGIEVYGVSHLKEVIAHLDSTEKKENIHINIEEKISEEGNCPVPDFAEIQGQRFAKRAAEIAAAGMHNLLLGGPPGTGKSMLARRIPGILPPMSVEEVLEVSRIHSVAGILPEEGVVSQRPFRMPHHTISPIALAGGGVIPQPGEISLAHLGVLYLDELPEFQTETLEILRQPMEEGEVRISRKSGRYVFPSDFMLVASRNPCKCGYYPDRGRCRCSEQEIARYLHRISRPLLDRIDLHVQMETVSYEELTEKQTAEESTASIRERVLRAHRIRQERYQGTKYRFNSQLSVPAIREYCALSEEEEEMMRGIYEKKHLTARSYHRILKVARTIADLTGGGPIQKEHLCEAVLYRPEERMIW